MARYCVAYSICQINGNRLARFLKRLLDEWNPMFLGYLLHENHLSEAIERTVGIVEDVEHHISLAAVETVRGELLLLPYGAHFSFHVLVFWEISQLLELVYADDNLDTFFLCQHFGKLQDSHLVSILRYKLLSILHPSFHLRRSTSYNLTGKCAIELSL